MVSCDLWTNGLDSLLTSFLSQSVAPQTLRRLAKEIRTLQVTPPDGVAVEINEADLLAVRGWVRGPQGTAFEGGSFLVTFEFTSEFPAVPPRCRMPTKSE